VKQDLLVQTGRAIAHPNIALIKYWGKSPGRGNEPAVSSLSVTLDTLKTETQVTFDPALARDELILNGKTDIAKLPRISKCVDLLRQIAGITTACRINSENNFPTGAGLASSASGFAALVCAANQALELNLDRKQMSKLARAMSGSAARSIFGGFAKISLPEQDAEGSDLGAAYAQAVAPAEHWPLEICVGIISDSEKDIGSTEGMERSRLSSPYYDAWLAGNDQDIAEAEKLVLNRDFEQLAELSEFSCLKMHALALASRPGLIYWSGATVNAMHRIRGLRAQGTPVFFTVDAGPQIKAICAPGHAATVAEALQDIPGVLRVIRCGLGHGARVLS